VRRKWCTCRRWRTSRATVAADRARGKSEALVRFFTGQITAAGKVRGQGFWLRQVYAGSGSDRRTSNVVRARITLALTYVPKPPSRSNRCGANLMYLDFEKSSRRLASGWLRFLFLAGIAASAAGQVPRTAPRSDIVIHHGVDSQTAKRPELWTEDDGRRMKSPGSGQHQSFWAAGKGRATAS